MTVAVGIEDLLVAQIRPHLPAGVQCEPVNPAEETKANKGSLFVDDVDVAAKFRGLGPNAGASHHRRHEEGTVSLIALCYQEAPSAATAASNASTKVGAIITAVEDAIEADPSFGGVFASCLLARVRTPMWAHGKGWTACAQLTLEVQTYP